MVHANSLNKIDQLLEYDPYNSQLDALTNLELHL